MPCFACDINATGVAMNGKAFLIQGNSGSGKSTLALQLIQRGGQLISDDVVHIQETDEGLVASSPQTGTGCLEIRSIGLISGFPVCKKAVVQAIVSLEEQKPTRLPFCGEMQAFGTRQVSLYRLWCSHPALADQMQVIIDLEAGKLTNELTLTERNRK